ncbi:hypothetical protein L249_2493 [Ophiocordyceps polyrhachis-furcata BCC 54312]|uniref:Uncharacterized protein n=1 Tax=Ophiocordyceps polyrhachis-furcata BCC 54312 TaxID=1330021 RepID=A0A367LQM2_9HYPO|nr:hypothetical protein L249_2493 [Ophiocordyceps polyrhachis-furcata BCC 54312]
MAIQMPRKAVAVSSARKPEVRQRPLPARKTTSQFLPIASLLNPHTGGLKRRRSDDDVDGPDTAKLSSKKRRLARRLVTSRLSSPYSQPASHIHGRTDANALMTGRASKAEAALAAAAATSAAHHRLPHATSTTSFLRLCAMNRVRQRLRERLRAVAARRVDRLPGQRDRPPLLPSGASTTTTTTQTQTTQTPTTQSIPHRLATSILPIPWSRLAVIDRLTTSSPPPADPASTPMEPPRPARTNQTQGLRDPTKETDDVRCDFGLLFGTAPSHPLVGARDQRGAVAELPELPLVAR